MGPSWVFVFYVFQKNGRLRPELLRQERRQQPAYFFARHPPASDELTGEGFDGWPVSAQEVLGVFANHLEKGEDPFAITDDPHGQPNCLVEFIGTLAPRVLSADYGLGNHPCGDTQKPPLDGRGGDARVFFRWVFLGKPAPLDRSRVLLVADNLDFRDLPAAELRHDGMPRLVVGGQSKVIVGLPEHAVMVAQLQPALLTGFRREVGEVLCPAGFSIRGARRRT